MGMAAQVFSSFPRLNYKGEIIMYCNKCNKGIIMKQLRLTEFTAILCECSIDHEMNRYGEWFKKMRANP
jgi:hypothetical protein